MPYWVLVLLFSLLFIPGVLGVFLPALPSLPWMFVVALIFGIIDKFAHLTPLNLVILGVIALVSVLIDYLSGVLGAKFSGASLGATLAGLIGGIVGLFVFPPWGAIVGVIAGALIVEYIVNRDEKRLFKVTAGVILGNLLGVLVNLGLAILFVALFLIFVWR